MLKQKQFIRKLSFLSLFIAILFLQNMIPFLGLIPVGPLSITLIHITVLIATFTLGTSYGIAVGFTWGLITFIRAFTAPTSPLAPIIFTNPITAILPRVMIALVGGWLFQILLRHHLRTSLACAFAGVIGTLMNTLFVILFMWLFAQQNLSVFYHVDLQNLLPFLFASLGLNGLVESLLSGILLPLMVPRLRNLQK